ncbi:MAG: HTTM domain-containing protein, partial [Thermoanaerobaculia bacterium]|nr:HTTM domain-containing protein [Thermoanaerobaculia bacterium]
MSRALRGLLARRQLAGKADSLRLVLAPLALLQLAELVPVLEELSRGGGIRTPYLTVTPPLSEPWIIALSGLWAAAALASLLGWRPRISVPLLALLHLGALLYDRQLYSNHFFLLTLLLLLLAAAELTSGGGRPKAGASPSGEGRTVAGWPLLLMRTQLTSVYLFAGLSKINPDFLAGRV